MDSIEPHHRYGKRFSLISIAAAIALVLGASVKAQEITEIRLDLNTYTLYDAAENHADVVRVTGDKPEGLAVLFHNVLVAPKVCPGVTFQLKGGGVSNSMNGVSLAIPSGPGTVKVQASGGTTTLLVDTADLPGQDELPALPEGGGTDGGDLEDLGDLDVESSLFSLRTRATQEYSTEQFVVGAWEAHKLANAGRYMLNLAEYEPQDVLVLTGRLDVTPETQMSFGGEAEAGVNFYLGSSAGVVVKKSWFVDQNMKSGAIGFGAGTLGVFEKGAVILIADDGDESPDGIEPEGGKDAVDGHVIFNVADDARLEGVENLKFLVSQNGHAGTMSFEWTEDGLVLVQEPWRYEGPLAAVVNELGDWAVKADAPRPLQEEFMRRRTAGEFGAAVNRIVAVMKGAGTSAEMLRTAENVVERTSRAAVAFEDDQAVKVTVRKGESRGRYQNVRERDYEAFGWTREVTGIDLEVNLRYMDRFAGLLVSYADADVESGYEEKFQTDRGYSGVTVESNVMSLAAYYGAAWERFSAMGFGTFSGGNDKVRVRSAQEMLASGEPSRKSLTAGVSGSFYPGWGTYKSVNFTGAAALTNFLKSTYSVALDGEPVMDVEERSRWVGTLQLQAGWHELFRPWPSSWIKADCTLGGRLRGGDLEVEQKVRAHGASAGVSHEDLTRGELFGDVALKVSLRNSVAGVSVGGSAGPDGSRSWTGGVTFDYQF